MPKIPWWQRDSYNLNMSHPDEFFELATGPRGQATVSVNKNGTTQPGWGLLGKKHDDGTRDNGFMPRYMRGEFDHRKTRWQFINKGLPFAFIMRSLPVLAVDIDGKNDGFAGAQALGVLPETLAETSKSGNGYHLFYGMADIWDVDLGFAALDDHIGIAQGVDIRVTGCVFHYETQRWNGRSIAPIPSQLEQLLQQKKQSRMTNQAILTNLKEMDDVDKLVAHHTLLADLAQPILAGRRNNTLFAIGSKMKAAAIPDWEDKIRERANQLNLDWEEADKLVSNIAAYGD